MTFLVISLYINNSYIIKICIKMHKNQVPLHYKYEHNTNIYYLSKKQIFQFWSCWVIGITNCIY